MSRFNQGSLFAGLLSLSLVLTGCYQGARVADGEHTLGAGGSDAGGSDAGDSGGVDESPFAELGRGPTKVSRLSRAEVSATIRGLLGVDIGTDVELLPADSYTPFDNDYTLQVPSKALVEGLKAVAERAVAMVLADDSLRDQLVGCTPQGPEDIECLREFVERFGRRALRRPLREDEVTDYLAFSSFSNESGDFYDAVGVIVRAMLLDLEFIYRFEIGTPAPGDAGQLLLNDWEVASRLSFLLWGEAPDDALLDAAQAGVLTRPGGRREAALRLLADDRGKARLQRFHALWLGYERLPHAPALNTAMRQETDALVRRVVFDEQRAWTDLFTSEETFVDATLAELYGLPAPTGPGFGWVDYGDSGRLGVLSHGSVLSNGAKGGDTSPTLRGKFIRERLMCMPVPAPPDSVNTDEPPANVEGADCKADRYEAHRSDPTCAACHLVMDGIGFGLENYDMTGRFRLHDEGKPECEIDGVGDVSEVGTFQGPRELAQLLTSSDRLVPCATRQLYHFVLGRSPLAEDEVHVEALADHFEANDANLRALLLDWIESGNFARRIVDEEA